MKPDLGEIAKITDYIVSYSCKGNITWQEEREQTKKLIMAADPLTNDKEELKRISKQVLNKNGLKTNHFKTRSNGFTGRHATCTL